MPKNGTSPPAVLSLACPGFLTVADIKGDVGATRGFYTEPTLLICDELGYLSLDQQTSNLFYQGLCLRPTRTGRSRSGPTAQAGQALPEVLLLRRYSRGTTS
jgi:hypothetical protein